MALVSVIIVNWNGRRFLADCLESLQRQTFRDFETILVDNGSSDGSTNFVAESYPWVTVVPLAENTGFAAGNNAGYSKAGGRFIVTLNNDTVVDPAWLAELVRVANTDERVGMVASRICQFQDKSVIDSLGVAICADGMSRGNYRLRPLAGVPCRDGEEVLLPSGCAALYRRQMIDQIGFFDDDFFAYCEDTDLGLRGRLAGWKALLAFHAVVLHKYSQTGGSFSPLKLFLVERNHFWLAVKCLPPGKLAALPWHTLVRYGVQARLVLSGAGTGGDFSQSTSKWACAGAFIQGMAAALAGLPRAWRKRCRIQQSRSLSWREYALLLKRFTISFPDLLDAGPVQNDSL